jgi:hypothetical protein
LKWAGIHALRTPKAIVRANCVSHLFAAKHSFFFPFALALLSYVFSGSYGPKRQ